VPELVRDGGPWENSCNGHEVGGEEGADEVEGGVDIQKLDVESKC
jgi:hypothetical protein